MSTDVFSRHEIVRIRQVASAISILSVDRHHKHFHAGQHIPVRIPDDKIIRDISIYSPEHSSHFEFLIRHLPDDPFTNRLLNLQPGDAIEIGLAMGVMTIDNPKGHYWFIATGPGVAPFHSIICTYPDIDYTLIHGIRNLSDIFDSDAYEKHRYIRCVSRGAGGEFNGRVTTFLQQQHLPHHVTYFLSGGTEMVFETMQILLQKGVQRWDIKSDQL